MTVRRTTLASQWIPTNDRKLWKIANFRDFLEARKTLLAAELNRRMEDLLHGDVKWLDTAAAVPSEPAIVGGITSDEEEATLAGLNEWVVGLGLPRGEMEYDYVDAVTGKQTAVFDLAWPNGLQQLLSQPVVVLLNEEASTVKLASQAGFRCFTDTETFKRYVERDVVGGAGVGPVKEVPAYA